LSAAGSHQRGGGDKADSGRAGSAGGALADGRGEASREDAPSLWYAGWEVRDESDPAVFGIAGSRDNSERAQPFRFKRKNSPLIARKSCELVACEPFGVTPDVTTRVILQHLAYTDS